VPVLAISLAACGSEPEEETAKGFDAVEISGEQGETPEFSWDAMLASGPAETEVISEGDGPVVKKGEKVLVNFAVSDDFTRGVSFDTFGEEVAASQLEVGSDAEPVQASDLLLGLVSEEIVPGETTVGTRIAAVVDVQEEWKDYASALVEFGIGNEDGVAIVAEVSSTVLPGPEGTAQKPAAWAPKLVKDAKGVPTALDSSGIPKPDVKAKDVRVTTLVKGTGPAVEIGDLAVVNYLGQTWGGKKPFDESYSKGEPLAVNVGEGVTGSGTSVIAGWSDGLVGVPVGSRVIIEIPPAKGYGKAGQGEDIKGDDILYFVVDVLGAA
jgi:peptidylprolyl isomerase